MVVGVVSSTGAGSSGDPSLRIVPSVALAFQRSPPLPGVGSSHKAISASSKSASPGGGRLAGHEVTDFVEARVDGIVG